MLIYPHLGLTHPPKPQMWIKKIWTKDINFIFIAAYICGEMSLFSLPSLWSYHDHTLLFPYSLSLFSSFTLYLILCVLSILHSSEWSLTLKNVSLRTDRIYSMTFWTILSFSRQGFVNRGLPSVDSSTAFKWCLRQIVEIQSWIILTRNTWHWCQTWHIGHCH